MNWLTHISWTVGALCLLAAGGAAAEERIIAFDSRVVIAADGELTVTETIRVRAEGDRIKRGIYRDFPTDYRGRDGRSHIVGFEVVEVRRDGRSENWFTKNRSNGMRLYAGRENIYLRPGDYEYTLVYRTDRQIGFFDSFDELYWNVTGNDWEFPIESARVTIVLPQGARIVQTAAYTGRQGATGQDWRGWTDNDGNPVFETTRRLAPGEGLTGAVAWPKGFVEQPKVTDLAAYFLRDYLFVLVAAGSIVVMLLFYLYAWHRVGRDPETSTIIPRWLPPKGLSPAAARYLHRMNFDKKAIGAAIVSLAVKGRLEIDESGGDEYTLRRRRPLAGPKPSPGEKALEKALFRWGDMAEIRDGNHTKLKPAVDALKSALAGRHDGVHFVRNSWIIVVGAVLTVLLAGATGLAGAKSPDPLGVLLISGVFVFGVLMSLIFQYLMKAPTVVGRGLMDEIEGFGMYLATAEQERLNLLHPPERTPELFERYLPYAMALDVETDWADQFTDVLAAAAAGGAGGWQPGWYHGHGRWDYGRSPARFADRLGSSLGGAIASAATPPGSSSGSGGGGFSGGGGGGGGGGGW